MFSSPGNSIVSPDFEDDLFKKLKLKHHRRTQSGVSNDEQIDVSISDECSTKSSVSDVEFEPYFEEYYRPVNSGEPMQTVYSSLLLTPDIDELQRKENELVRSLSGGYGQVNRKDIPRDCFQWNSMIRLHKIRRLQRK